MKMFDFIDKAQDYDSQARQNQRKLINIISLNSREAQDYLFYIKEREDEQKLVEVQVKVFQEFIRQFLEVSNPTSTFRIIWELISMLFIFIQIIYVPMQLSFQFDIPNGMDIFNEIMDVFFFIDIALNFNLGYYHNGDLVVQRKAIIKNYITLWFWVDLIAVLPYDSMLDQNDNQSTQIIKIVRLFKFIKIVRLLRILKLGRILVKIEETFSIEQTLQVIIQFLKITSMILCIAHWIACIINIIEMVDEQVNETWMMTYGIYDSPWEVKYITALYFSVTTMITVGYGDIHPNTNLEMIFGIAVMVISSGIFGYSMASLMLIIQGEDQNILEIKNQNQKIIKYIKQKGIPKQLQNRVRNYLEWLEGSAQVAKNSEFVILNNLSANLHTEIVSLIHGRILKQVNLITKEFSPQLQNKLVYVLNEHLLGPEEYVFKENQVDSHLLYFIQNGQISILLTQREFNLKTLYKGDYFGEISFFSKIPRTASAKTLDFVNLMSLNRKDLWECAKDLDADLQKLYYIKNCVDVENSFRPLKIRCFICDRPHHIARNCSVMHFRVRRLKIIEEYLQQKNDRNPYFKRGRGRFVFKSQSIIHNNNDLIFRQRFLQMKYAKTLKEDEIMETQILEFTKQMTLFDDNSVSIDKYKDYSEFYSEFNPSQIINEINIISDNKLQEIKDEKEQMANKYRQNWINSRKLKQLQLAPPRQSKSSFGNIVTDISKQSQSIQQLMLSEVSLSPKSSLILQKKSTKAKRLLDLNAQKQVVKRSTSRSKLEKLFQQEKQHSFIEFKTNKITRSMSFDRFNISLEILYYKQTNIRSYVENIFLK